MEQRHPREFHVADTGVVCSTRRPDGGVAAALVTREAIAATLCVWTRERDHSGVFPAPDTVRVHTTLSLDGLVSATRVGPRQQIAPHA